jgi:formylglycine-generating enzyme required for sulfatase activity
VLWSWAAEEQPREPKEGRKVALLVSAQNHLRVDLRDLQYVDQDIDALADVLCLGQFARVRVMSRLESVKRDNHDAWPIVENVQTALDTLLANRNPADTVLFAFSGHCVQFKDEKEVYLCTLDAKLTRRETLLPLSRVYEQMKSCRAGTRVCLFDICRKDSVEDQKVRALVEALPAPQKLTPPEGVMVLFSTAMGQMSEENDDLRAGVFMHFLLEGLRGPAANKDEVVTLESATRYTRARLAKHVENLIFLPPHEPELLGKSPRDGTPLLTTKRNPEEFVNTIGMRFRRIPAGKFFMGSPLGEEARAEEQFQHEVEIKRPFYLAVFETTQAQYEHIMGEKPSRYGQPGLEHLFPVERVTWEDATRFCDQLSRRTEEKRAGRRYRLPTEAEWEYACRAGDSKKESAPFYFAKPTFSLGEGQAGFDGNPYGGGKKGKLQLETRTVGSFQPNAFGLYDMHGNVSEWCSDWYSKGYYADSPGVNPVGPKEGEVRVIRGGSWYSTGTECRAARRGSGKPDVKNDEIGFRVVLIMP